MSHERVVGCILALAGMSQHKWAFIGWRLGFMMPGDIHLAGKGRTWMASSCIMKMVPTGSHGSMAAMVLDEPCEK